MIGDVVSIYDEYQIVINEAQRRVIMRALTNAMANDRLSTSRGVVQPKTNICSLFGCSAPLSRLCGRDGSEVGRWTKGSPFGGCTSTSANHTGPELGDQDHADFRRIPDRSVSDAVGRQTKLLARLDRANLPVHGHNPSCLLAVKGGSCASDSPPPLG